MKTCLNTATTRDYLLADDVRLCGKYGYEGIEIDVEKLDGFLKSQPIENLRALLDENRVVCTGLMAFAFQPFSDHARELERIRSYGRLCRQLGGSMLLAFIAEELPQGMCHLEAVEKAGIAARCYAEAVQANLKIALEPIGGASFMAGPTEALAIVNKANHPDIGIIMDTFHYYKSGVTAEEVREIPVEKLLIIHINDCEDRPLAKLTDGHRLYPGLGTIPLKAYLDALQEIRYDGFLSVEIFREEYWKDSHENIIRKSKEHLDRLLTKRQ